MAHERWTQTKDGDALTAMLAAWLEQTKVQTGVQSLPAPTSLFNLFILHGCQMLMLWQSFMGADDVTQGHIWASHEVYEEEFGN